MDYKEFFSLYLQYTSNTESSKIYHRMSIISAVSALLGRSVYTPMGHFTVYPNQYILLVSTPGTRKDTAINIARDLIKAVGYTHLAPNKMSKEAMLIELQENVDVDNELADELGITGLEDAVSHLFICAGEFLDFAGQSSTELMSQLTALWDCPPEYVHKLKNAKSPVISKPTLSLLGGATPIGFRSIFPAEALGHGILTRILLVVSEERIKKIAFPVAPDKEISRIIEDHLSRVANLSGEVTRTPEAEKYLEEVYLNWQFDEESRMAQYQSRRFTHLLKILIVLASLNLDRVITLDMAKYANTILFVIEASMEKALWEFGSNMEALATARVITCLTEAEEPVDKTALYSVMTGTVSLERQTTLILALQTTGKIQQLEATGKYTIITKVKSRSNLQYVDLSLLHPQEVAHLGDCYV